MESRIEKNSSIESGRSNFSDHFNLSTEVIIKASAYAMIMAFSLCGNVLVLVVVKKNVGGQLRSVSNYLLTSMATIDLVITVGSMPERLVRVLTDDEWLIPGVWGTVLCKATNFFERLGLNVTVLNLVLIATDRFFVVMFPYKNILASRRAFVAIACVWIVSTVYCAPVLYYGGLLELNGQNLCKVRVFFPNWKAWYVIFLVELVLTFLVVVMLYALICYKLTHRKYQTRCQTSFRISGNRTLRKNSKVNRKVVKMVAAILLAFYACFLPYWIGWVFCSYHYSSLICNDTYIFISIFLSYLNSSLNPFIYCAFSEAFRDAFKSVLRETCPWFLCCRKQVHPVEERTAANVLAEFALDSFVIPSTKAERMTTRHEGKKRESCIDLEFQRG